MISYYPTLPYPRLLGFSIRLRGITHDLDYEDKPVFGPFWCGERSLALNNLLHSRIFSIRSETFGLQRLRDFIAAVC
jgi:hypothetical protein